MLFSILHWTIFPFESAVLINLLIEIGGAHKYKGRFNRYSFYLFDGGKTTLCQCLRLHVAYAKKNHTNALMDVIFNIQAIIYAIVFVVDI